MSIGNINRTSFFCALLLQSGLILSLALSSPQPVSASFTEVATHPDASNLYSPGTYGATVQGLRAYNNRLYMGYSGNDAFVIKNGCPTQDWYPTADPNDDPDKGFCKMKLRYYDPIADSVSVPQATFK